MKKNQIKITPNRISWYEVYGNWYPALNSYFLKVYHGKGNMGTGIQLWTPYYFKLSRSMGNMGTGHQVGKIWELSGTGTVLYIILNYYIRVWGVWKLRTSSGTLGIFFKLGQSGRNIENG